MNNSILEELKISENDSHLYEKANKVINFMKTRYAGEDLRFVSAYLFNDSKIIDKNSKLRKLFTHFATVERPNIIYIRTDTDLKINSVSIKELTDKLHICAFFGGDIKTIDQEECSVVISENLSFFMSAQPNNAIFLYSKGFHLINSLSTFVKRLKYSELIHFGDADFEGLAIFEAFKNNLSDIAFYPKKEIIEFIINKYSDILPVNNQVLDEHEYKYSKDMVDLISSGISIEQEFVHTLFYKNILEKPAWIK